MTETIATSGPELSFDEAHMTSGPMLSAEEARAIVETKVAPRITEDWIKSQIRTVRYVRDGTMTICIIEMANSFKALGKSAPASAANYDADVGERYAFDDAFKLLWQLEAYRLLTDLQRGGPAGMPRRPEPPQYPSEMPRAQGREL